jgi:hypothetical protein
MGDILGKKETKQWLLGRLEASGRSVADPDLRLFLVDLATPSRSICPHLQTCLSTRTRDRGSRPASTLLG